MQESENHVRHLHAGVVDVVLHFHATPGVAQQPRERVAQHRIAQVADVRRFVRIDAGVLDHDLWRPVAAACRRAAARFLAERREKTAARSKNAFRYPPPATSTRATPGIGFSEFAISCASARGGFFSRLASSKQSGEATSPMESFGGRSVTIGTSSCSARECDGAALCESGPRPLYTRGSLVL